MAIRRYLRQIMGTYAKPVPYYDENTPFTGEFDLIDEREWPDLVQTDDLVLSVSQSAQIGGSDNIKITANGDAITVPGAWVNRGSDSISTTDGDVNRITVYKAASEIQYVVKVN